MPCSSEFEEDVPTAAVTIVLATAVTMVLAVVFTVPTTGGVTVAGGTGSGTCFADGAFGCGAVEYCCSRAHQGQATWWRPK